MPLLGILCDDQWRCTYKVTKQSNALKWKRVTYSIVVVTHASCICAIITFASLRAAVAHPLHLRTISAPPRTNNRRLPCPSLQLPQHPIFSLYISPGFLFPYFPLPPLPYAPQLTLHPSSSSPFPSLLFHSPPFPPPSSLPLSSLNPYPLALHLLPSVFVFPSLDAPSNTTIITTTTTPVAPCRATPEPALKIHAPRPHFASTGTSSRPTTI